VGNKKATDETMKNVVGEKYALTPVGLQSVVWQSQVYESLQGGGPPTEDQWGPTPCKKESQNWIWGEGRR
jgi:hypothetical protein